jgi:hypothetical protein
VTASVARRRSNPATPSEAADTPDPTASHGPAVGSWAAERQQTHRSTGSWRTRLRRDHRRLRTSQLQPMLPASRGTDWALARMRARIHTGTLSQNDTPPSQEIRSKLDTSVRSITAYRTPVVVAALGLFAAFLIVTAVATAAPRATRSSRRRPPSGGVPANGYGQKLRPA